MSVKKKIADAIAKAQADLVAIQANVMGEIDRLLSEVSGQIKQELSSQPSDFQIWHLTRLQKWVGRAMTWFGDQAGEVAAAGARDGWEAGVRMVDEPVAIAAAASTPESVTYIPGPASLSTVLPITPPPSQPDAKTPSSPAPSVSPTTTQPIRVTAFANAPMLDKQQLVAIEGFLTHKMKDISADTRKAINRELGLVVTGLQGQAQAATAIERLLKVGGRRRALTVVRTEVGRAFSIAAQRNMEEQVAAGLTGLKKKWRRSGKIHSRVSHDLADGQVVAVHESFKIGGESIRFPRDPEAKPAQTINCGCTAVPHSDRWEMKHPAEKPISEEEIRRDPRKIAVVGKRAAGVEKWIKTTLDGTRKADGEWRTVGTLPMPVVDFLRSKGVEPATMEIAVSDHQIKRPARAAKVGWGKALPIEMLTSISSAIDSPKAIYWGEQDKALHYVFEVPGEQRLGKLVVRVRATDTRSRLKRHNYVVSGGLVNRDVLLTRNLYEPIIGGV
ncbi:MAG: hypothetical protein HQL97_04480 [Magnetococcales bacterium]|nr:hypothetical protein [Magnetococcales bacterium]